MILWKVLQHNESVNQCISNNKEFLMFHIVFAEYLTNAFNTGQKDGVFQTIIAIYLKLTQSSIASCFPSKISSNISKGTDREYTAMIQCDLDEVVQLKNFPIIAGTYGDLIFTIFCHMVEESVKQNDPLLKINMIAILKNLSTSAKRLSPATSLKMCFLLGTLATPRAILMEPQNLMILTELVAILELIFTHQFDSNIELAAMLIKQKKIFKHILNLSVDANKIVGLFPGILQQLNPNHPQLKQIQDAIATASAERKKPEIQKIMIRPEDKQKLDERASKYPSFHSFFHFGVPLGSF